MKHISLTLLSVIFSTLSYSQANYTFFNEVPVLNAQGDTLQLPFAGGLNNPQFSNIDLDGDNKQDLFVFDRKNNVVKCFINKGDSGQTIYDYGRMYEAQFPSDLSNFALLRDYNCDGDPDIYTRAIAGIRVYKNDGTNHFDLSSPLLYSDYGSNTFNLYNSNADIPAIDDIDYDGDMDILAYDVGYNQLTYHVNTSMETYGTCDSLDYLVLTRCWGEFAEGTNNNSITLDVPCPGLDANLDTIFRSAHAGSTLLTLDYDGDYDKDFITGDVSFSNAVYIQNGGDSNHAVMDTAFIQFPLDGFNVSPAVDVFYPAGYYVDVNSDGKKDLLFASNSDENANNTHSVWYYANQERTDSLSLVFEQDNFMQDQMIDVGEKAVPVFFDYNSDGKLDIVIGTRGYFESTSYQSKLMLLENIGLPSDPIYKVIDTNFADISSQNFNGAYPTFGDLDSDGDKDMVIGDETGRIHYFENIAASGANAEFQLSSLNYMNIDVGDVAVPQLFDFNTDGALDLIIGERDGGLFYYENSGTSNSPNFSSVENTNMMGGVDVLAGACCNGKSAPFMTTDASGDKLLYVGSDRGYIYVYSDIVNYSANFTKIDSIPVQGIVTVSGGSVYGVPNDVLLVGEGMGGFHLLKQDGVLTSDLKQGIMESDIRLFPNPASETLSIFSKYNLGNARVEIFDLEGRMVMRENFKNKHLAEYSVSFLSNGLYTVKIQDKDNIVLLKFVKASN